MRKAAEAADGDVEELIGSEVFQRTVQVYCSLKIMNLSHLLTMSGEELNERGKRPSFVAWPFSIIRQRRQHTQLKR